jgi:RecB family endonuclease NucS
MSISSVSGPAPEDALELLEEGFEEDVMLTLVGECEVEYEGRASSYLPAGERLVILKPDGTLLVHRTEQRTPVNWQPPGCTHTARTEDDRLIVHSTRSTPNEQVTITFETVLQLSILDLDDAPDLALEGSEEDLRQHILSDPDSLEEGFVAQMTERETAAGAVDIYGKDADGVPTAVELKRRRVGPDAVGQLNRYVDALDRELPVKRSTRGILVAPSVTDRAERLLAEKDLELVALGPEMATDSTPTQLTEFGED